MVWIPRATRSGATFSPYTPVAAIPCPESFAIGPLLRWAIAQESDDQVDKEEEDDDGHPSGDECAHDPLAREADIVKAKSIPATPKRLTRSHAKRDRQRKAKISLVGQLPRPKTIKTHVKPAAPIHTPLATADLPATSCGYRAKSGTYPGRKKKYSLQDIMAKGFQLISWDGFESRPLFDNDNRIVTCLVGQPRDETYAAAAQHAHDVIIQEGAAADFQPKDKTHRRGDFPVLNVGVTSGLGASTPLTADNKEHTATAQRLLANVYIQRLAIFASASFALWAPKVYDYYRTHLDALWAEMPHLRRNFTKSIFPSAAFNFGPNVWTFIHRDPMNCPFGWCAIQAMGNFNPKLGGHLILWDLKMVIEFPPGALILIPSATLFHSNIPTQPGESRVSFTQYCAGGLFRFVDNGFKLEKELAPDQLANVLELKKSRYEMGIGLFSTLDELLQQID